VNGVMTYRRGHRVGERRVALGLQLLSAERREHAERRIHDDGDAAAGIGHLARRQRRVRLREREAEERQSRQEQHERGVTHGRKRRHPDARKHRRKRNGGAAGQPPANRPPQQHRGSQHTEQCGSQQRRVPRIEDEVADAARAPLAQRSSDELDNRVQRAHVCRALAISV
jgi:hypothetical protein